MKHLNTLLAVLFALILCCSSVVAKDKNKDKNKARTEKMEKRAAKENAAYDRAAKERKIRKYKSEKHAEKLEAKRAKIGKQLYRQRVYCFAFAASFLDSIAYIGPVHAVDSVILNAKDMMSMRQEYSYQLKDYMELKLHKENYTPMIFFNVKEKDANKQYAKLRQKYQKKGKSMTLLEIPLNEFRFKKEELDKDE